MTDLRYPIGKFKRPGTLGVDERNLLIHSVAAAPGRLRDAVAGLSDAQLDTPYRPDGWTVRQVAHHLPDSHMNAYIRIKLALTEDVPTIRTYEEARWAELPDAAGPVSPALDLLEALHVKWVYLFEHLADADWSRRFHHPESGETRVDHALATYAWHGEHHIAHITRLRDREGW